MMTDDGPFGWPAVDAPGRYEITCSCGRWTFAGTAPEIAAAGRRHDDSPRRNHVVVVMHGGRRIDRPDLEEMIEPTDAVIPPWSPKPWDGGIA